MTTFPFAGSLPEMIGLAAGPASCSSDGQCPAGMYCGAVGVCLADTCKASSECGPTRVCWNHLCLPADQVPAGSECSSDGQCPADRMCSGGYCIRRAQHIKLTPWKPGSPAVNPADPGWGNGFKKTSDGDADTPPEQAKPAGPNYYAAALLAAVGATIGTAASSMATRDGGEIAIVGVTAAAIGALAGSQL